MASNMLTMDQCSSSAPPAKRMSCLPSWICSTAAPMQWALVAQAEEMLMLRPLMWKGVARQADTVLLMIWVTR